MSVILHIRQNVLGVSQKELAAIAETSQGTVSRWETGELYPDLAQLRRIRNRVIELGKAWDDSWLFDTPAEDAPKAKRPDDPTRPVDASTDDDLSHAAVSEAAE